MTTHSPSHSRNNRSQSKNNAAVNRKSSQNNGPALGADFAIEKITPELAAKIVKHFVLPMFDNAPSAKLGRRLGHK